LHVALWLFGWGVTIYSLLMLPALVLLLWPELRATRVPATMPISQLLPAGK
jgi:hypothetical protein